jgi:hypothetical protein
VGEGLTGFVTFVSGMLKFELMFYMRTYLKIEGGKRQGEKSKIDICA